MRKPSARYVEAIAHSRSACAVAALVLCAALGGCRSLGSREPVSESVAMGRQLTQQGANSMERGDWKRAESLLERAVATSPSDADARRNYAEALLHRGAMQQALAQLEQARKLTPGDPGLTVRTGEIELQLAKIDRAEELAEEALRIDPKFASAWALRGRVAAARGQPRKALADYQRALGYAYNDEVTVQLAEAYRQLNQPEQALAALQSVADRYSPGEEPQRVLHLEGLALSALGRHDDAARVLALAAQRQRPSADLLCHLAEAEFAAGRTPNAQYALQQALAQDPAHGPSRALTTRMATASRPIMR
ncbi:MAG: hypothetical protein DWQ37_08435 [Planctomycetota bacterium]|nr:MAG: hypothetical protein DWQ37_08435 [Planctomycetota bacterium]